MKVCTYEGCRSKNPKHFGRGLCKTCYQRKRDTGKVEYLFPAGGPKCSIPDCDRAYQGRGYCYKHYRAMRLYGDPLFEKRPYRYGNQRCSVDACERTARSRGMCHGCYEKWRKRGTTERIHRVTCEFPGCTDKHYGHGLCKKHWRRWCSGEAKREILRHTVRYPPLPRLSAGPLEDYIAQHFGRLNAHELARLIHGSSEPDVRMARDLKLGRKGTIRQADADRICVALGITPDHLWPAQELMSA